MAPELLGHNTKRFSKKVDMWALGCVTFELLCLQSAFSSDFDTWGHAQDQREWGQRPPKPNWPVPFEGTTGNPISENLWLLTYNLLEVDPSKRPNSSEAVRRSTQMLKDCVNSARETFETLHGDGPVLRREDGRRGYY